MKHFHAFFFLSSYEKFSETKVSQAEPGKYRRITWYLKIKHSIPSGDSEQGSRGSMETFPLGMLRELHLSQGLLCAGWPAGGGVPEGSSATAYSSTAATPSVAGEAACFSGSLYGRLSQGRAVCRVVQ